MQEYSAIGATAVVVTLVIQILKRSRLFPWLTLETANANRIAGALAAALVGLGLHWHYDPMVGGSIYIPSLPDLAHSLGHCFGQWGVQQVFYKTAIAEADPAVVTMLRQIAAALQTKGS